MKLISFVIIVFSINANGQTIGYVDYQNHFEKKFSSVIAVDVTKKNISYTDYQAWKEYDPPKRMTNAEAAGILKAFQEGNKKIVFRKDGFLNAILTTTGVIGVFYLKGLWYIDYEEENTQVVDKKKSIFPDPQRVFTLN